MLSRDHNNVYEGIQTSDTQHQHPTFKHPILYEQFKVLSALAVHHNAFVSFLVICPYSNNLKEFLDTGSSILCKSCWPPLYKSKIVIPRNQRRRV